MRHTAATESQEKKKNNSLGQGTEHLSKVFAASPGTIIQDRKVAVSLLYCLSNQSSPTMAVYLYSQS